MWVEIWWFISKNVDQVFCDANFCCEIQPILVREVDSWKVKIGMSWRLFPCSNFRLGEFIQLEVLHSTFFSNNWFWDFRMVNNITLFVRQTKPRKWFLILDPNQNLAYADCNSALKKCKLWWSPDQRYQCFKKKDVCGFEQMSDNLLLQFQNKWSKR